MLVRARENTLYGGTRVRYQSFESLEITGEKTASRIGRADQKNRFFFSRRFVSVGSQQRASTMLISGARNHPPSDIHVLSYPPTCETLPCRICVFKSCSGKPPKVTRRNIQTRAEENFQEHIIYMLYETDNCNESQLW